MGSFKSMYTDYACEPSQTLVGPKLTLEANAAGSLEFSVLPGQDGYDNTYTRPRHGYLVVLKDGEPIWDGRVTTRDMDWNNSKSIYAEGALSYLNDIMIQSLEDTSDFKTARANAKTDLKKKESAYNKAKKAWEDGGSKGTGDLYNKYITAKKNLGCAKKNYSNCVYNSNILDPTDDELLLELMEDDYYGENGPKIFEMMLEKYNAQAGNSNVHNQFVLGDVFVPAIHEAYEAVDEDDYLIEWDSPDFTTVYEYFNSMLEKIPNTYLSVTYEYDKNNLLVRKLNWLLQGVNKDNVKTVKQYYNTNVKAAKTAYNTAAEAYNKWYVSAYKSAKDAEDIDATIKSKSDYAAKHNPLVTATNNLKTVNAAWNTYIKSLVDYSSSDIVVKQTVNFGENLLDFKRNIDSTEMFTRLIPIGEDDLYLNDDKSSAAIYVQDNELVAQYGVITRKMNFDKIRDVKTLKQQAKAELAKMKARIDGSKESIEITALDLRYLDSTAYYGKSLNIYDVVDCISAPHGFLTSNKFPVLKEEIDMAQPENTKFTLNAIVEYQSATSQLASTSANTMATASTVSTLGSRQNSNITYSSVKVNPIVTSGIELATINDISIYAPRGEEVYYGTSLPTVDIGQDSSLYYKIIQRPEDLKTLNVVEYIQSAIASYIPTDILMTNNTRIMMRGIFYRGDYNGGAVAFGIEGNDSDGGVSRFVAGTSAFRDTSNCFFFFGDDYFGYRRSCEGIYETDVMVMADTATRTFTISGGGTSHSVTVPSTFAYTPSSVPIGILCSNMSSEAGGFEIRPDWRNMNPNAIIKRFQVYYNNVLAYDLMPVQNANDVTDCGLYDRIHRKYYPGVNYNNKVPFTAGTATGEVINQLDECVEAGYLRVNDEWWEIYNGGTEYFAGNYIEITENNVITSTLKAGTNIQIADDGTISASGAEIVQTVTSGTQLATINGTSIYAPTVSATQTQTSGTEIATINVGDASTKLYAPETTVTQTLTEGTEIGAVNGTKLYAPTGGGSDVTVTPITTTGTNIANIAVNGTTYQLFAPSSGGGGGSGSGYTADLLFENTDFSVASGTSNVNLDYTLSASIDDYDAVIVSAFSVNKGTTREQVETIIINKSQYYTRAVSSGTDDYNTRWAFKLNGTYQNVIRDLYFGFADNTTLKTVCRRNNSGEEPKLYRVYGLKFSTIETAFIYSNEERVVGVWTDNKPLYAKTVYITCSDNNTDISFDTTFEIKQLEGGVSSNNGDMFIHLGYGDSSLVGAYEYQAGTIRFQNFYYSVYPNGRLTMYYTKTTDTPGSGPYVTSGAYAHHYSTTEQVVGTWIDGKTLYERTFTGTCPNRTGQISIQTLDEEISAKSISGYIEYAQGTDVFIPNYESSTWKAIFTITTVNGVSDLRLDVGSDFFNKPFYITSQYTKTS